MDAVRIPGGAPIAPMTATPALPPIPRTAVNGVVILNNGGNGVSALSFNQSGGYIPPDTQGASGPGSYVETVNQAIALYKPRTVAVPATMGLDAFFFTQGGLPRASAGSFQSDPVVEYNEQIGRYVVGDQDVDFDTHVSRFDVAVSKSSDPSTLTAADWTFFSIVTTESGYDADYPGNFGYNHDATVFTLNMFPVSSGSFHTLVISVSNASLLVGPAVVFKTDLANFSVRPTAMHGGAAGDPMWLVTEHGDGLSIDVIRMTGVLSASPTFTTTNLAVTPYSTVVPPLNPDGSEITGNIDSRILKAAAINGSLVATHHVAASASQDVAQWYVINVSGASPALAQVGRVADGNNTYCTYPGIDINPFGQIGLTYMESGHNRSDNFLSMYVTGRNAGDPPGTMLPAVVVPAGTGQANYVDFGFGRAGDMSGINVDPVDGTFWACNEFANTQPNANWGTAIAQFTFEDLATPTLLSLFDAAWSGKVVQVRWGFMPGSDIANATVEYAQSQVGPWTSLGASQALGGGMQMTTDPDAAQHPNAFYRLVATNGSGQSEVFGPVSASGSAPELGFALLPIQPNPSTGPARIAYTLPRGADIKLSVLDVQGRRVALLVDGPVSAGRHETLFGAKSGVGPTSAGLYFVRMEWPGGSATRRVALAP